MAKGQTRQEVLHTVNQLGRATVGEIADRVGVKPTTLRHHLNTLSADGFIEVEEQRQTVGRSVYVYRMTLKGYRQFPHIYTELVNSILEMVREGSSPEDIDAFIQNASGGLAEQVREEFANLTIEDRLTRLLALLGEDGYIARWRKTRDGLTLVNFYCPFTGEDAFHPELCSVKNDLIEIAIGGEIQRDCCVEDGDHYCSITVLSGDVESETEKD